MNLIIQTIASPMLSEILCDSFIDGIILDTEHGCFNNETLYSCIQVVTLNKKQCYVRFTDLDKQLVRMCLDAGVNGLVFSTIEHCSQIKSIVEYCNYPSKGGKRGCGLVRQNIWGKSQLDSYKPIIVAQIETRTAIEKIQELIEEDIVLDYFLIGPYDISSSLGVPGKWEDPTYKKYIDKIYESIPLNKLGVFLSDDDIEKFDVNKNHPNFLVWGTDFTLINRSIREIKNINEHKISNITKTS